MKTKRIIGYVSTADLAHIKEQDIHLLDVINIAFALVKDDRIVWKNHDAEQALSRIRKHHAGIKILLSVGGWGADGFSQAAGTESGRTAFAKSAVELLKKYRLDGIDIDWEYPGMSLAGIASAPDDGENFILLLKELRMQLSEYKTDSMLTIAAGGDTYFTLQTDMKRAAEYLDYVQLMTYDLQGGFQKATGHHAALYPAKCNLLDSSVDKAVKVFIQAGIPAEKLIIGIPFYGRQWRGVKADEKSGSNGLGLEAATVGGNSIDYIDIKNHYIGKNGFCRYWDEEAMVPWLFNGDLFISYEDEESIPGKLDYMIEHDLGGVMFWEYKCDPTGTLLSILKNTMMSRMYTKGA